MVGQISLICPLASSATDKLHTQGTRFKPINTSTVEEFSPEVKKHLPILVCRAFESKDLGVWLYLINRINFPPPNFAPLNTTRADTGTCTAGYERPVVHRFKVFCYRYTSAVWEQFGKATVRQLTGAEPSLRSRENPFGSLSQRQRSLRRLDAS